MIPPGSCICRDFNAPSYIYIQNQPLPFDDLEISVVFQRRLDKHKNKKKNVYLCVLSSPWFFFSRKRNFILRGM